MRSELLNEMLMQNEMENVINNSFEQSKLNEINRRDRVKAEWKQFLDEAFTTQILQLIEKNPGTIGDSIGLDTISVKSVRGYMPKLIIRNKDTYDISILLDGEYTVYVAGVESAKTPYELSCKTHEINAYVKSLEVAKSNIDKFYQYLLDKNKKRLESQVDNLNKVSQNAIQEKGGKKYRIVIEIEDN